MKLLSILCSALYFSALVLAIRKQKNFPIGPLFLLVFGGVVITRPLIAAISSDFDIAAGSWMYWGTVPDQVLVQSLTLILLFLVAIVLVFWLVRVPPRKELRRNRVLEQVSVFFLIISSPLYAYRGYVLMSAIANSGYLATFTGEVQTPLIVNIGYAVFQVSYYTFLAANPAKNVFGWVTLFFLALSATSLGSGQRTEFVSGVLFAYWAGLHFRFYEFRLRRVLLMAVPLLFLSIAVNAWRLGIGIEDSFLESILSFFWGQGVTIFSIFGVVENRGMFSTFEGLLFPNKFLSCDIGPFFTGEFCANNAATVELPGLWWQRLSFILDPEKFLEGGGLGGNLISSLFLMFNFESFGFSAALLVVSTALFFFLVMRSESLARWGIFGRIYFVYLMHVMTFLPRAALDSLVPHLRYMIAAFMIMTMYGMLRFFSRRPVREETTTLTLK